MPRVNLQSLASFRSTEKKLQFCGQTVYAVENDDIIEGTLENILPKTARINGVLYKFMNVYMTKDEAETRFVRNSLKRLKDESINWSKLLARLNQLKEAKPHLFI